MDIEKLIDTLKQHGVSCVRSYGKYCSICDEAATSLSTLQAEKEELRAELEEVKRERDAAVERLREWEKFDIYLLAHNFLIPEKWRGIKED